MLAHGVIRVVTHFAVHAIHAAGYGLCQSATADDGVERQVKSVLLEPREHVLLAKFVLVGDFLKRQEFFGSMTYGAADDFLLVVEHADFRGC